MSTPSVKDSIPWYFMIVHADIQISRVLPGFLSRNLEPLNITEYSVHTIVHLFYFFKHWETDKGKQRYRGSYNNNARNVG